MAVNRMDRINAEIHRTLSNTLAFELKNPELENKFISVTSVSTTPDLKYCDIFISIFPDKDKEKVFNSIKNAIPFMRKQIAQKVKLRIVPELHLKMDYTMEYSSKIDKLIVDIHKNDKN